MQQSTALKGDNVMFATTNLEGIITYANTQYCSAMGYKKSELIGKNMNILRHPEMPRVVFEELWENLKNEKEWVGIIRNCKKEGQSLWVEAHMFPTILDDATVGYVSIIQRAKENDIQNVLPMYKKQRKAQES